MSDTAPALAKPIRKILVLLGIGFLSGFLAVFAFHQPVLAAIAAAGFSDATPFSRAPAALTGIPQVLATALWGGVWGSLLVAALGFSRPAERAWTKGTWLLSLAFGAALPTLVAGLVVAPLKGLPVLFNGDVRKIATAVAINAAWGLGTAFFAYVATRQAPTPAQPSAAH